MFLRLAGCGGEGVFLHTALAGCWMLMSPSIVGLLEAAVAAAEVLHAVVAYGSKAGWKDWRMPGKDVETKGEEKRLIFHVWGRGDALQGPGAQLCLPACSSSLCASEAMQLEQRGAFSSCSGCSKAGCRNHLHTEQLHLPAPERPCVKWGSGGRCVFGVSMADRHP